MLQEETLRERAPYQETPHDTAVVVVIDEATSYLLFTRSRRTGLWRSPGDRIRDQDIDPEHPFDRSIAADNTAQRAVREIAGLAVRVRRVVTMQRALGMFYGYAGLADFKEFAPHRNGEDIKIVPFESVWLLDMSLTHRMALETIVNWIRS